MIRIEPGAHRCGFVFPDLENIFSQGRTELAFRSEEPSSLYARPSVITVCSLRAYIVSWSNCFLIRNIHLLILMLK